ncbi:PREDICTED: DNA-directed RNA polymerases II IV and V subunit 6A [Prunus dulcis]|uniref:PREDICTED: DNA-directed RNA polymerases II IV and V subunit 6A n=1 Tax=Prunus dulcis TaxID=3755 RepID=A0A5E4FTQ3_PRUDU|nr:PREDICTED: DNA-directed RNA polymerases II IV and V subunit 6A [Prunus dulcis]
MTKYECARILGTPAVQSSMNGPVMVELQGLIHLRVIVLLCLLDMTRMRELWHSCLCTVSLHHQLGLQERIGAIGQGRNLLNFIISRERYIFLVKKGKHVMAGSL